MQRSNTNTIPSTTSIALYAITSHIILYEMASIKYIDYEKNMIFILGLPGKARLMLNIVFHTIRYIVIYISRRMVLIINAALFFLLTIVMNVRHMRTPYRKHIWSP